jgi:hypothetical protein
MAYLPPSNGADDLAMIQSYLDVARTKPVRVIGLPGETYSISDALVVRSRTTLDMTNCVIAGNPAKNMLRNAASVSARTVTDAVTTEGSATVTSATAHFTAADVGRAVGVLGAGPNYGRPDAPGTWYGTVASVTSATTAALSQPATLSVRGARLSVFPARDTDIVVTGGAWNGGSKDAISQTLASHGFYLRRVDNLTLSPRLMTNTRTTKGGGYAISLGDVTNVETHSVTFNAGADGVHVQGPARYIDVHDIFGTTNDDMVAFTGVDGQSLPGSLLGDVEGDITDVTVSNIFSNGSWTALKLISGTGTNNALRVLRRFRASGLTGRTQQGCVNVVDYAGATWFEGEIAGIEVHVGPDFAAVTLGASHAASVRLRDIVWDMGTATASVGVVNVIRPVSRSLSIDGLTMIGTLGGTAGSHIGVRVAAPVTELVLTRFGCFDSPASVQAVDIAAANVVIEAMHVTDFHRDATAGNLVQVEAAASNLTLTDLTASDGYSTSGSVLSSLADSTNPVRVRVSNWRQTGGALVIATFPCEVDLANVEAAPSAGAVRANSTAATPVRVRAHNCSLTSGSLFSRTDAQALSATGAGCEADLSMLTPHDQDVVNNTNAALSCGTGLAVFHRGGTGQGWKNVYSGATY